jgi:hypothetical protein
MLFLGCVAVSTAAQAPPNHPSRHPAPANAPAPATAMPARPPAAGHISMPSSAYSTVPVKKTASGEQFFIVASLDLQKQQLLLKYPTEVTLLVKATPQTTFVNDSGQPMKLADLRAGDTVWLTSTGSSADATALKVRKGQMTVADLHRYYLDYSEIK